MGYYSYIKSDTGANQMKKVNYAFVSTGAETKMYTLCTSYQEYDTNGALVRNGIGYVKNLSKNRDTAIEKAIAYCSANGIDIRLDVDLFELNAFEYGKAKKLSRAEAKAIKEQQKIEEEERNFNVMLSAGVMQIGKYTGMTAADVYAIQPSYIEYAANQNVGTKKNHFAINVALCKQFMEENPELFVKEQVKESEHIGNIGEAVNVEMKISTVRIVDGFAYNSKQLYVVGFDKDNNKIALYTTKKEVYKKEEGDKLVLSNAVVKKHTTDYNHKNMTIVGGRFTVCE